METLNKTFIVLKRYLFGIVKVEIQSEFRCYNEDGTEEWKIWVWVYIFGFKRLHFTTRAEYPLTLWETSISSSIRKKSARLVEPLYDVYFYIQYKLKN